MPSTEHKLVRPSSYKSLAVGDNYIFETYSFPRKSHGKSTISSRKRSGKLVAISSKVRDKKDKKGKNIQGTEVVGDRLVFIPIAKAELEYVWATTGEVLKLHEVNVCCGRFNVFISS